jgi:acyl carrier protein
MTDAAQRLVDCFAAVFPNLPADQLPAATAETVAEWDSVAQVTLIAAVEEEFGISIDPNAYGSLVSFQAFRDVLAGDN